MPEEIKDLIAKIKNEGIKAAQDKSSQMELEARASADKIIKNARASADKIIKEAMLTAQRSKSSTEALLKQTGRDMVLSLKKEILFTLDKVVKDNIRGSLTPEEMIRVISSLVKANTQKDNVVVALKGEDLKKIQKGLLAELSDELKKRLILKPSDEISAGFTISYDAGKSLFDFSEEALVEYIGTYLKPELNNILKD
jgi:vacuolar-type H+-ATPase subunit E/Vma4